MGPDPLLVDYWVWKMSSCPLFFRSLLPDGRMDGVPADTVRDDRSGPLELIYGSRSLGTFPWPTILEAHRLIP